VRHGGAGCCLAADAFGQATVSFAQLNEDDQDAAAERSSVLISLARGRHKSTYTAASNTSGFLVVSNLSPGNYELTVQNSGFANNVQTGIALTVGQRPRLT